VAIASPYPVRQTEKRATVLIEEGFEVVGHRSLDIERTRDIAQLDPQQVRAQAIELAIEHPEADVIYMPCGSLPVTTVIDDIERTTGKPVVTNVQAQIAANLRRLGYPSPISGYGRLLAEIAPAA
jgi:maleate isomerase